MLIITGRREKPGKECPGRTQRVCYLRSRNKVGSATEQTGVLTPRR